MADEQLMWAHKSSTKTESLSTLKSSRKLLPRLTNTSCWLINHQQKLSLCRLRNLGGNCFHGDEQLLWAQKSSTKTQSLPTQKSSRKLLPRLTNSSCGLRNHQRKLNLCRLRNH